MGPWLLLLDVRWYPTIPVTVVVVFFLLWPPTLQWSVRSSFGHEELHWWKNRRERDTRCKSRISISRSHINFVGESMDGWMDEWRRIKESLRWNGSIGSEEVSHHIGLCSGSSSIHDNDLTCCCWLLLLGVHGSGVGLMVVVVSSSSSFWTYVHHTSFISGWLGTDPLIDLGNPSVSNN